VNSDHVIQLEGEGGANKDLLRLFPEKRGFEDAPAKIRFQLDPSQVRMESVIPRG
jgi:hypothetical protein